VLTFQVQANTSISSPMSQSEHLLVRYEHYELNIDMDMSAIDFPESRSLSLVSSRTERSPRVGCVIG
jgi:hypothetical protein